jgi:hypothetical protein
MVLGDLLEAWERVFLSPMPNCNLLESFVFDVLRYMFTKLLTTIPNLFSAQVKKVYGSLVRDTMGRACKHF